MIGLPNYQLYLFDLDDTLINTKFAYSSAQEFALKEGFKRLPLNDFPVALQNLRWFCQCFGSSHPEEYFFAFAKNIPSLSLLQAQETHRFLLDKYSQSYWKYLKPFSGSRDYLERLTKKNKKIGLVSNGISVLQRKKLRETGFDAFFSPENTNISGDFEEKEKKPSPEMIHQACTTRSVSPENTVFFGNSVLDILAGNQAEVTTVFYEETGSFPSDLPSLGQPDFFLKTWKELSLRKNPSPFNPLLSQ